ncbi:MAG: BatD family protein, partial [Candidatus Omnitrophica bacterium]|nr:BatD family protein [Candidatus Omnitrophota bacterium]
MKKLFLVAVLASGVFSYSPVLDADEPQLSATVDKHTARVNEEIHLNVKVTGARGSLQAPHLPSLEQFEIFYSGRSSRFSFVNGRSESMTEFNYVLIPRSAGRFVVQPIEIRIDDKLYQTNQLEIQIEESQFVAQPTAGGISPVPPRQFPSVSTSPVPPTGRLSAPTAASSGISDGEIDQNIFLWAIPTQTSVFTIEQLVL